MAGIFVFIVQIQLDGYIVHLVNRTVQLRAQFIGTDKINTVWIVAADHVHVEFSTYIVIRPVENAVLPIPDPVMMRPEKDKFILESSPRSLRKRPA